VEVEGNVVSIVATSDYGRPDKLIWTRKLSDAEEAFFAERINAAPLAGLKDEYRNPDVWDGLQIHFTIRQSAGNERLIPVANEFVEELAALCDVVNLLLPIDHRIHYREWKWSEDVEAEQRTMEAEPAS
jgi:hypothetical protein